MKKLSTYLFLFLFSFSAPSFADDISEYQIEGISLGDSLLDHFSEKKIKKEIEQDTYNMKGLDFIGLDFNKLDFKIYNALQIYIKPNDEKFIIYSIDGIIDYSEKNFKQCLKNLNNIAKEISNAFTNAKKSGPTKSKHGSDKSGKSFYTGVYFYFKSGDYAEVTCYEWSDEAPPSWVNNLRVGFATKEFYDWIKNK